MNLNLQLSKVIEDGVVLKNVYGAGFTGLSNLGNSCYMNSVVQVLFSLEPYIQRFYDMAIYHLDVCTAIPTECYECQMSKIMLGIYLGQYSEKKERKLLNNEGKKEIIEEYQSGIRPRSFKNFFNKGHQEFFSNRQQDSYEYLNYLLEKIDKEEIKLGKESLQENFEFDIEEKLTCTECKGFKIKTNRVNSLIFTIPDWKEKQNNKTGCLIEESMKSWLSVDQVELNCVKCNKKTSYLKRQRMKNFPNYLFIVYQRFVYDWVPYKLDIDFVINYEKIDFSLLSTEFTTINNEFKLPEEVVNEEVEVEPEFNNGALNYLLDMGIPEICAKHALLRNKHDQNLALDWYFNNSEDPSIMAPIPKIKKGGNSNSSNISNSGPKADPETVLQLEAFGFTKVQAEGALLKFNNNIESASDFLFNNPDFSFTNAEKNINVQKKVKDQINSNNSSEHSLLGKLF